MIVAEHSPESLSPSNRTVKFVNVSEGPQQPISEPLMVSLAVIVGHIG